MTPVHADRGSVWARAEARMQGVAPYLPGAPARDEAGKLSSNEAPSGPSPRVVTALARAAAGVHRYPDEGRVRGLLAETLGLPRDRVLLTNGSDELCYLIASLLLAGAGNRVVTSDPAYAIDVKVSVLAGAEVVRVPLRAGAHDLTALAEASDGAQVLWLPSPHNPTGSVVPPSALAEFLRAVDPGCTVVLDEAYRGFTAQALRPDVRALLDEHPNLLVQRTFSKEWALAGLRVGYGLGDPRAVELLARVRAPFSVNALALVAAEAALADEGWHETTVRSVVEAREQFQEFLDRQGVGYTPSQANFVAVHLEHTVLEPHLQARGLTVRPGEALGLPGWVRVSIGTPQAMALLRDAFRAALSAPPPTSHHPQPAKEHL